MLSWQEIETYAAHLCRRDGCTNVLVSGKSGNPGADVVGYLDGHRKLVIQGKKYAPQRQNPKLSSARALGPVRCRRGPCR